MTAQATSERYARRLLRMPGENQIQRQLDAGAPDRETAIWRARIDFAAKCERWDRGEHFGAGSYRSHQPSFTTLSDEQRAIIGIGVHDHALSRAIQNNAFRKRHEEDARLERAFRKQPHAWSSL